MELLRENLKTLKAKIIDSSKLLSIYSDARSENEVLKEQNKKLREDFVLYKNENPIDVQIAQFKEMKAQFDEINNKCISLQQANEQLSASMENNQRTREENDRLKALVKDKEKQVQSLKDTLARQAKYAQESRDSAPSAKLQALEAELSSLRVQNVALTKSLQSQSVLPDLDFPPIPAGDPGLDSRIREIIRQSIPTIAKAVGEMYALPATEGRPRPVPTAIPMADSVGELPEVSHSIFQNPDEDSKERVEPKRKVRPVVVAAVEAGADDSQASEAVGREVEVEAEAEGEAEPEVEPEAEPEQPVAEAQGHEEEEEEKPAEPKERPAPQKAKKELATPAKKRELEDVEFLDMSKGFELYAVQEAKEKWKREKKLMKKRLQHGWHDTDELVKKSANSPVRVVKRPQDSLIDTRRVVKSRARHLNLKEIDRIVSEIHLVHPAF